MYSVESEQRHVMALTVTSCRMFYVGVQQARTTTIGPSVNDLDQMFDFGQSN